MEPLNNENGFRSWSINNINFASQEQIENTEKKFDEMRYRKGFVLKGFHTKTYSLCDEQKRQEYEKDYSEIIVGQYIGTHFLFSKEKKFIESKGDWAINMEWAEFEVQTEILPNIATAESKKE